MKRKIFTTALLVCSFMVCLAAFADLAGKWTAIIRMGDGNEIAITYIFKTDGEKLTGTVISPNGELPIYDGKITGNDFTFKVDVGDTQLLNVGKITADSTYIDADFNGRKLHSKLKRASN
jgi:hypothetical protein